MRFTSGIIQKASGSAGGYTYSHNAGGMYIRARSTPTDPGSAAQVLMRSIVSSLVNLWNSTLTAAQRAAWDTYAANVPLIDVFGDPRYRSGINHYVRSNAPRLQSFCARIDDGPTTFNLGEFTSPSFGLDVGNAKLQVNFTEGDDWVGEDGAYLIVWLSLPKNNTIQFFKGPYVRAGLVAGNSGAPETSPYEEAWPHAFVAGQQGFFRVNVSRADGRLGTDFRGSAIAA